MEKNLNQLKEHIRAVEETRQITNAMYLLSASRMKKLRQHVDYNREYFNRIRSAVKDILSRSPSLEYEYLTQRPVRRAAYLVIAGDKGMAGAYNHNVLDLASRIIDRQPVRPYIATIGILRRDGYEVKNIDFFRIGIPFTFAAVLSGYLFCWFVWGI